MVQRGFANHVDTPLLVIVLLLTVTLGAFVAGFIPYPFGIMVLSLLLVTRLFALAVRKRVKR